MKLGKKIMRIVGTSAICLSLLSTTALAVERNVPVAGYETLTGVLTHKVCHTSVKKNPDNAFVTSITAVVDRNGTTLWSGEDRSEQGRRFARVRFPEYIANAYAAYGTHIVSDGNTYGRHEIYTYERF